MIDVSRSDFSLSQGLSAKQSAAVSRAAFAPISNLVSFITILLGFGGASASICDLAFLRNHLPVPWI
jgi:hypothetical protein